MRSGRASPKRDTRRVNGASGRNVRVRGARRDRCGPGKGFQPAEGVPDQERRRRSMRRHRKWSRPPETTRARASAPFARAVTGCQTPAPGSSRRVENTRCGSEDRWQKWARAIEASGSAVAAGSAGYAPLAASAWVLVFDKVGCISRPDASGLASKSSAPKGTAAGEPARGAPRHPRHGCRGAKRVTGRARLSTSRGQPGGQVRAANEILRSLRARLKALRAWVVRS